MSNIVIKQINIILMIRPLKNPFGQSRYLHRNRPRQAAILVHN